MIEVTAPNKVPKTGNLSIFLAGSIEMDSAEDWQRRVVEKLEKLDVLVLNPRREKWDPSWKQDYTNPSFYQQVNWELTNLNFADIIFMYFSPGTTSPISLLEFGLQATNNKLIVCCPEGFWRKGNVDIVCDKYNIPLFEDLDEAIKYLIEERIY